MDDFIYQWQFDLIDSVSEVFTIRVTTKHALKRYKSLFYVSQNKLNAVFLIQFLWTDILSLPSNLCNCFVFWTNIQFSTTNDFIPNTFHTIDKARPTWHSPTFFLAHAPARFSESKKQLTTKVTPLKHCVRLRNLVPLH